MPQANFGSGDLIFQPPAGAIDAAPGVVATPIRIGTLQDVQLDYSVALKELMGGRGFAVEAANAERKITGKAKFGKIDGRILAMCLDGSVLSTGSSNFETVESGTVSAGAVTVAGSANFVANLGVYDATGTPYKQVASAPTGTQYSVAAGVYTFNVSQNAQVLTFRYTQSKSSGNKLVLSNTDMGIATKFGLKLYNTYTVNGSKVLAAEFAAVVVSKLSLPFKNTDFTIPDVDFSIIEDGSNNVGTFYVDAL